MDSKLKCVFEMPVENNETAGDSTMDDTLIVQEKLKKMEVKPSSKVRNKGRLVFSFALQHQFFILLFFTSFINAHNGVIFTLQKL